MASRPKPAGPRHGLANAGDILSLVATGTATSRPALLEATGLSRVTVAQRLGQLLASGMVRETSETLPSGGRPTRVLGLNARAGIVLVANIGEAFIHLAIMDLEPAMLAQATIPVAVQEGPAATLDRIAAEFEALVARASAAGAFLAGIGFSMPTPVDFSRGRVVGPSVLFGWDEFDIGGHLRRRWNVPVYVENDVNLMTIYEHRVNFPTMDDLFFIKAGTGIGSGIISNGRIFRGAQGAAGDIGHIQLSSSDAPLCRCGKLGCVEARAAGWAIARELSRLGIKAVNARDVIDHVLGHKPEAIMLLRNAGRVLGEVTSDVVSILNPKMIVVGGTLAGGGEFLLSGIRELVYQRCLPLATRDLQIKLTGTSADSALIGAAYLTLEQLFSHRHVEDFVARYERHLHRAA
jgi:predicted NBD/HSP70 family sugar kinase